MTQITTEGQTMTIRLRSTESVWRDNGGGFVAEVRGLYDQERGVHEWVRLGVYGTRHAALAAVAALRDGA